MIGDNRFGDAVQVNDIIEEQTCELGCIDGFEIRDEMTHFHEAVDEYKERIICI